MGGASAGITFSPRPPTVILMAGLQGSGKTTATREARALPATSEHGSSVARRRLRRLPPGRGRPARQGRRPGRRRRSTSRAPTRDPVDIAALGARPGEDGRQGRPDRRHRRPPARRRGADGRAQARSAGRSSRTTILLVVDAMTGQDAVNVAEQFAEAVALRRRRDDQARRRRPRRRRAVGQGGHRQADPVRLDGREARPVRALPPRPHGPAHPRHGRRPVVHREGRAAVRRGRGRRSSSASCARTSSRSRTSSSS